MRLGSRRSLAIAASVALVGLGATGAGLALTSGVADAQLQHANLVFDKTADAPTATPIKHVVVIFDENVSFDHYFATYPTPRTLTVNRSTRHPGHRPSTALPAHVDQQP